jgi:hypothetical protein
VNFIVSILLEIVVNYDMLEGMWEV